MSDQQTRECSEELKEAKPRRTPRETRRDAKKEQRILRVRSSRSSRLRGCIISCGMIPLMAKILILGGSGFLSGTMAREAVGEGHEVWVVTRGQRPLLAEVQAIVADRKERDAFRS